MNMTRLRITSRHIFGLAIILVILAGLFSSQYMSKIMYQLSQKEASLLLNDAVANRAILIQAAKNKSTGEFLRHVKNANMLELNASDITINLGRIRAANAISLHENEKPSIRVFNEWRVLLIAKKKLTFDTYFSKQKLWLTININYQISDLWYDAAVILLIIFCIFILLLIGFVLHYRYMLASELMYSIKDDRPEQSSKSPTLISNLRQQIKNYYEEKNIMITALAHDIKTPLTEAMLKLELLDDPKMTRSINENLEKINYIVKSSLDYAEQPDKLKTANVELVSLVENVVDDYKSELFDIILIKKVASCEVKVEVALFKRMINNLIENAKKYATSCEVMVHQKAETVHIICQDDGPGVPEAFIQLLAIPYFRVDQARTSGTGGSGLGLAIVKKIAELHNGSIHFENRQGGGFRAIVIIPIV